MAALNDKSQTTEATATLFAVTYTVAAVISVILVIIQTVKYLQDFYSNGRKSVAHRNWNKGKDPSEYKPKITPAYQVMNFGILLSSIFFTGSLIGGTLSPFSTTNEECTQSLTSVVILYQCGKTSMYSVFLVMLYRVYEKSPWNYPRKCINVFLVVVIVLGVVGVIIMFTINDAQVFTYGDPAYPNWCGPVMTDLYAIFAGYLIIQDLIAAIGFISFYILPLKKIAKSILLHEPNSKILVKIANLAHRTTVIASFCTISTLILLFLTAAVSGLFSVVDTVVSQICIILFSAYYPDGLYNCLCGSCLACFKFCCPLDFGDTDVGGLTVQNEVKQDSVMPSVDTWSAVRIAGANVNVQFNYSLPHDGYAIRQQQKEEERLLD